MYRNVIGAALLVATFAACADDSAEAPAPMDEPVVAAEEPAVEGVGRQALATFINDQGTQIGTARLTQLADGVEIVVDLAFLQAGERGYHIHGVGSCEAPSFESAGDHFNPTNASHGFDAPQGPHAGDLRNLEVETDDGTARGTQLNNMVTLADGQPNSLLDADGSALIVHRGADDYTTQPGGNTGERIACGVIEAM